MNRIYQVRYWTTISLASFFVAISYELRTQNIFVPGIPGFVSAIFAFLIGATLAMIIIDCFLGLKMIRRIIIGEAWVEGYWLIRTDNQSTNSTPLSFPGILFLEYKVKKGELKGVTTRLNEKGEQFVVNSEIAFVREEGVNVTYLNYFKITYPGPGVNYGMAFAEFSKNNHYVSSPNILEGNIALEVKGEVRRQSATKIPDAKIKQLRNQFGNDWMRHVLLSDGNILIESEAPNNRIKGTAGTEAV